MTTYSAALNFVSSDLNQWVAGRSVGFELALSITAPAGFTDANLLVFQDTGDRTEFVSVANPVQLADLKTTPNTEGYFLGNNVTFVVSGPAAAQELQADLQEGLKFLCDEMSRISRWRGDVQVIQVSSAT